MHPSKLRCSSDLSLYESLLQHADVRRANEALERRENEGPVSIRRRLLAGSVRLSRRMAGAVHDVADECVEKLDIGIPLELYVYPSPQTNAACFKPEDGRLFVIFSSNLLETFSGSELRFVMGHELGHHLYRHHDIPIGFLLGGHQRTDARLALDLFAWSRYAEISADRAGAHCAQDIDGVAKALFKLASGLSGNVIAFSLDDFLAQVDEMRAEDERPGAGALREDWFSTHPFSPLRVKALKLFDDWVQAGVLETGLADLDTAIQGLMSLMEPSYMEGRTDAAETMRRLLFVVADPVARVGDVDGADEQQAPHGFGRFGPSLHVAGFHQAHQSLDGRVEIGETGFEDARLHPVVEQFQRLHSQRTEGMGREPVLTQRTGAGPFVLGAHLVDLCEEIVEAECDDVAAQARGELEQRLGDAVDVLGAVSPGAIRGDLGIARPGEEVERQSRVSTLASAKQVADRNVMVPVQMVTEFVPHDESQLAARE